MKTIWNYLINKIYGNYKSVDSRISVNPKQKKMKKITLKAYDNEIDEDYWWREKSWKQPEKKDILHLEEQR